MEIALFYLVFLFTWFWFGYIAAKAISRFVYSVYGMYLSKSAIFLLSFAGYVTGVPVIFCKTFDAIFFRSPILKKEDRNGR